MSSATEEEEPRRLGSFCWNRQVPGGLDGWLGAVKGITKADTRTVKPGTAELSRLVIRAVGRSGHLAVSEASVRCELF